MAWHISNTLYEKWRSSQGPEAVSSEANSLDGNAYAPSNGSHTPLLYLPPDRMKDFSRLSRYGMTFKPLTEDLGTDLLTWYLAASRAKTSVQPEKAQASTVNVAGCGKKWRGSLAKFDPDTRSWRTAQYSLLGDLELFSETWPRWGTMRNGECSEQAQPEVSTNENVSGLLPTVPATLMVITGAMVAAEAKINNKGRRKSGVKTGSIFWWDVTVRHLLAGGPNTRNLRPDPAMGESLMGWPLLWTDTRPLETDRIAQWYASHGIH